MFTILSRKDYNFFSSKLQELSDKLSSVENLNVKIDQLLKYQQDQTVDLLLEELRLMDDMITIFLEKLDKSNFSW